MTPENFVYWLQGFLEIQGPESISKQQVEIIKDHVALVLKKDTPDYFYLKENINVGNLKSDPPVPLLIPLGGSC